MQVSFKRMALVFVIGLILILSLLAVWGCFTLGKEKSPAQWKLSPEAEKIYYYLSLEQASRSGDIEEVKEAVKGLCEVAPSPQTYLDGAAFLLYRGEKQLALEIAEKGLALYPNDPQLILLLAEIYIVHKQNDKAISMLSGYVKSNPEKGDIALRLAELLLKVKRYAEANDVLQAISPNTVTEEGPEAGAVKLRSTPFYQYTKARALLGMGQTDQAETLLKSAIKEEPEFIEAWAELAFLLEKNGRLAEALELYQSMLDLDRENTSIWLRIVNINLKLNQVQRAYNTVQQGPPELSFLMSAGTLFMNEKLYPQAESIFLKLVQLPSAPDEAFLYLSLVAYEDGQKVDQAVAYLDMILPDSPIYERATLLKIQTYSDVGRFDDALNVARNAKAEFPAQRSFWQSEAIILHQKGDEAKAEAVLNEALTRFPNDSELMFAKGAFYDQIGRKSEAIQVMEDIIKIYPDDAPALNYIGYTLAEKNEQLDRAYTLISKALQVDPENAHIIDSLAWVQYRQKNYQAAWDTIIRAIAYEPKEAAIWEHYGDIAKELNKNKEAKEAYIKALELKPENPVEVERKLNAL